jgi:5-methylcytosine-specific restriction protein A
LRPSARERGYTRTWEKARKQFLLSHPCCAMCGREGRVTAASVVDHIKPHRGDKMLFWDSTNWQALCSPCHNRHKQREERGSVQAVGEDGWPI